MGSAERVNEQTSLRRLARRPGARDLWVLGNHTLDSRSFLAMGRTWRFERHAPPKRKKHDYFFSSSMPFVALPGLVAQQKTESLPHFSQTCLTSFFAPCPVPTVVMVLLQPGHKCFAPTVITWICPFSVVTLCTMTDLHFSQTIATASPGCRLST